MSNLKYIGKNILNHDLIVRKGNVSGSVTSTGSFGSVYAATHITARGNISGSSSTTGSFGRLDTADSIYASGRIYESGTSVIDHATAMAIVFGG